MLVRGEIEQLRACVQNLAIQVARLSQAMEPLVRIQEEQGDLRDRVSELEGFRSALLWAAGLLGTGALLRFLYWLLSGGKDIV